LALTLYAHPLSSYCQKVLIALYENSIPFEYRMLSLNEDAAVAELLSVWPLKRIPVLLDGERTVVESSIIIEHLGLYHPGSVRLIPERADHALPVRMMDRFFDNYIMSPMQRIVLDSLRAAQDRDHRGVTEAKSLLETAYGWLNEVLSEREWAAGGSFSLADCAGAPSLFYADWVHPITSNFLHVQAYRRRLLARPSYARAVEEARPYRSLFPLGAPDRD
jgi:glutathione S-transferase